MHIVRWQIWQIFRTYHLAFNTTNSFIYFFPLQHCLNTADLFNTSWIVNVMHWCFSTSARPVANGKVQILLPNSKPYFVILFFFSWISFSNNILSFLNLFKTTFQNKLFKCFVLNYTQQTYAIRVGWRQLRNNPGNITSVGGIDCLNTRPKLFMHR